MTTLTTLATNCVRHTLSFTSSDTLSAFARVTRDVRRSVIDFLTLTTTLNLSLGSQSIHHAAIRHCRRLRHLFVSCTFRSHCTADSDKLLADLVLHNASTLE